MLSARRRRVVTVELVTTPADLRADARDRAGRRAVVMTMGALHDGHAELMRAARRRGRRRRASVIATVFVNPTQFGCRRGLRPVSAHAWSRTSTWRARPASTSCSRPTPSEVYGPARGFARRQRHHRCGPARRDPRGQPRGPGHFRGVLTVVAKLMGLTRPDVALFGEKDYQQLVLIRRMAARPEHARARSSGCRPSASRTASPGAAATATSPRQSERRRERVPAGARGGGCRGGRRARRPPSLAGRAVIAADPGDRPRLPRRSPTPSSGRRPCAARPAILVAAKVGATRLIDNRAATVGP